MAEGGPHPKPLRSRELRRGLAPIQSHLRLSPARIPQPSHALAGQTSPGGPPASAAKLEAMIAYASRWRAQRNRLLAEQKLLPAGFQAGARTSPGEFSGAFSFIPGKPPRRVYTIYVRPPSDSTPRMFAIEYRHPPVCPAITVVTPIQAPQSPMEQAPSTRPEATEKRRAA
jgi:hypothetical protein